MKLRNFTNPSRLLVIEPDFDVSDEICDLLRDEGHEVLAVRNMSQALYLLRAGMRPDLVIVADDIPEFKIQRLYDRILTQTLLQDVPSIVLTRDALNSSSHIFQFNDFLKKPLDPKKLLFKVRKHTSRKHDHAS